MVTRFWPGSLSWDAPSQWSAQPAVDLHVTSTLSLSTSSMSILISSIPKSTMSTFPIAIMVTLYHQQSITSTRSLSTDQLSYLIFTFPVLKKLNHLKNCTHIDRHRYELLLPSSDNYIESAVRGDNLNFHLVIDIEWVWYSGSVILKQYLKILSFLSLLDNFVVWCCDDTFPTTRWADIPLITDGALIHAHHRYCNWSCFLYVYCVCTICLCVLLFIHSLHFWPDSNSSTHNTQGRLRLSEVANRQGIETILNIDQ